jgi:hypothetical protein
MTIPNFKSPLAACLTDFIGYKQALNCKYRTEANVLQMFGYLTCLILAMRDGFLSWRVGSLITRGDGTGH